MDKYAYSLRAHEATDFCTCFRSGDIRYFYIEKMPILPDGEWDTDSIVIGMLYGAQTFKGHEVRDNNSRVLFRYNNPVEMIQRLYEEAQTL